MELASALEALGLDRAVWIDDYFEIEQIDLFELLFRESLVTASLKYPGIAELINEFDVAGDQLRGFVDNLTDDQRRELEGEFLEVRGQAEVLAVPELSGKAIERTGELLGVKAEDKISFEEAKIEIPKICAAGDGSVGYVVDLSNRRTGARDGLDTLYILAANGSSGTIFVLTHEATQDRESALEVELRNDFEQAYPKFAIPPICVISKQRIDMAEDDNAISEALTIALKRAGLRKSVHGVLSVAERAAVDAIAEATRDLQEIPPEQLDKFIVERAYKEGVSELHVVERALSAKVAEQLRSTFMANIDVAAHVRRIRSLQPVKLKPEIAPNIHAHLEKFRRMEIWEDGDLLNGAHSPIACGDVFVSDTENSSKNSPATRRFLLLGQQCDLQLRSDGRRAQSYGYFIQLSEINADWLAKGSKFKTTVLPFQLNSSRWKCDFRAATQVRLSILDLCSFRTDGKVAFDTTQVDNGSLEMLPGLSKLYPKSVAGLKKMFEEPPADGLINDVKCQLTFSSDAPFNNICMGAYRAAKKGSAAESNDKVAVVSWSLKREGRIRMPYSASLLKDFLSVSGRDAFDLDFALPDA